MNSRTDPPMLDTDPTRVFYVTVMDYLSNDYRYNRWGFLVGPFATHQEALDLVTGCQQIALRDYARAEWYLYGTASLPKTLNPLPPGCLHDRLKEAGIPFQLWEQEPECFCQ